MQVASWTSAARRFWGPIGSGRPCCPWSTAAGFSVRTVARGTTGPEVFQSITHFERGRNSTNAFGGQGEGCSEQRLLQPGRLVAMSSNAAGCPRAQSKRLHQSERPSKKGISIFGLLGQSVLRCRSRPKFACRFSATSRDRPGKLPHEEFAHIRAGILTRRWSFRSLR